MFQSFNFKRRKTFCHSGQQHQTSRLFPAGVVECVTNLDNNSFNKIVFYFIKLIQIWLTKAKNALSISTYEFLMATQEK